MGMRIYDFFVGLFFKINYLGASQRGVQTKKINSFRHRTPENQTLNEELRSVSNKSSTKRNNKGI